MSFGRTIWGRRAERRGGKRTAAIANVPILNIGSSSEFECRDFIIAFED
jgi:hypothetical protein